MNWRVPFAAVRLTEDEKAAVREALDTNWLTMGPKTAAFEKAFAELHGEGVHAVSVSNCTAALHLALAVLGIGPGDEVIAPSLTFVATANAVRYVGATPVFVDIVGEDDLTMSPASVEAAIGPKTRAIIPMHHGGYPCAMDALSALARTHRLKIVEDAAHAPLARIGDSFSGAVGDFGCFSFFSNKNLAVGEGGMILTRNADAAERLRRLRGHGMTRSTFERHKGHAFGYDVEGLGFNYRIDEMRAALGLAQLPKLAARNRRRRELVLLYRKLLRESGASVGIPFERADGEYAFHLMTVLLPRSGPRRDDLMAALAEKHGVQTSYHYRPVHQLSAFAGAMLAPQGLPATEGVAPFILSLPLFPEMTEDDVLHVVSALCSVLKRGTS
jgi:dTDP-4-amino-4,6-dideoxygalactose transaminase